MCLGKMIILFKSVNYSDKGSWSDLLFLFFSLKCTFVLHEESYNS